MHPSRLVLGGTALLLAAACRDAAPTAVSARPSLPALAQRAVGPTAAVQALTVDQVNDTDFTTAFAPFPQGIAQGFTPTASRLDAVDLFFFSNGLNPALTLTVHIRSGAWNGPVLGTTSVAVPAGVTGQPPNPTVVQAVFAPIPLTPGDLYYIQVDPDGGFLDVAATGSGVDHYLGGEAYLGGNVAVDDDIGFRTYFAASAPPGPTTREECKHGGWATFTVPRRFKNQGDCIKYVNTGK
jgi:hypothetical protein